MSRPSPAPSLKPLRNPAANCQTLGHRGILKEKVELRSPKVGSTTKWKPMRHETIRNPKSETTKMLICITMCLPIHSGLDPAFRGLYPSVISGVVAVGLTPTGVAPH